MNAIRSILERMVQEGLVGKGAHVETRDVFTGLDWKAAGARLNGSHTLYQLLNHMIYWQQWVLKWLDGKRPRTPTHAAGGWPGAPAPGSRAQWVRAVRRFRKGLAELDRRSRDADLLEAGRGKSRAEMLQTIGAHNSYHAGQAVLLRQILGKWPPPSGGLLVNSGGNSIASIGAVHPLL